VQVLPFAVALALARRKSPYTEAASMPLFLFWLVLMGSLCLSMAGIAPIFTGGGFSPFEIFLTTVIVTASAAGAYVAYRGAARTRLGVLTVLLFSSIQTVVVWFAYGHWWPAGL
jgi:hypothetical protein